MPFLHSEDNCEWFLFVCFIVFYEQVLLVLLSTEVLQQNELLPSGSIFLCTVERPMASSVSNICALPLPLSS